MCPGAQLLLLSRCDGSLPHRRLPVCRGSDRQSPLILRQRPHHTLRNSLRPPHMRFSVSLRLDTGPLVQDTVEEALHKEDNPSDIPQVFHSGGFCHTAAFPSRRQRRTIIPVFLQIHMPCGNTGGCDPSRYCKRSPATGLRAPLFLEALHTYSSSGVFHPCLQTVLQVPLSPGGSLLPLQLHFICNNESRHRQMHKVR